MMAHLEPYLEPLLGGLEFVTVGAEQGEVEVVVVCGVAVAVM
jgi:hypothetical protein